MISDSSCQFFQNLLVTGHCTFFYSVHAQTAKRVVESPPWVPVIKPNATKINNQKREMGNQDESAAKNEK